MEAVGYPPESVLQDDAQRQLLSYLYSCDLLLVIDNIDNLVDGFNLLAEILEATSKVKILATSHHQLNLSAESIFMLDGLDYPQEGGQENANLFSAVQLFSEGATHTVPDYAPKPGDLEHIAHICRQVQGMPLAIVLAANWTLRLSLSEIDNEISLMISRYSATQVKDHLASTIRWDNEYIMRSDEPG